MRAKIKLFYLFKINIFAFAFGTPLPRRFGVILMAVANCGFVLLLREPRSFFCWRTAEYIDYFVDNPNHYYCPDNVSHNCTVKIRNLHRVKSCGALLLMELNIYLLKPFCSAVL